MDMLVDVVIGPGLDAMLGFLIGLNVYSIFRLYYWRRARFHYIMAISMLLGYFIGIIFFDNLVSDFATFLALTFCVFYAWRRISIIAVFEERTGIRVRQQKYSLDELKNPNNVQPYQDKMTGGKESPQQKLDRAEDDLNK